MDPDERRKQKFENDTMRELCQNRKKENFEQLKNWDQTRAHYLITHRKVADEIDEAIQSRLAESDEFLKVVIQFLTDIDTQQKKYESESVSNPESKLKVNATSRNIEIVASKCLQKAYNSTQNFKSMKKVKNILEEGINKIEEMLSESEREVMEVRTKVELLAVEIQNMNGDTSEKCDRVVDFYKQDKSSKIFQNDVDLFSLQQTFIQQAFQQTETQCTFAQTVIELLELVEGFERNKLHLIKGILEKYLTALSEARPGNESMNSLIDILEKHTEEKYIDILYSSEEMLSKELLKEVRKVSGKLESETLGMKEIRTFLTKLKTPSFDCRNLILKEYRIYIKFEEELEDCIMLVTVDGFIHLYQSKAEDEINELVKPDSSVSATNLEMEREGDIKLNLKVKKFQLFGKHETTKIVLVFMSEDQREEFMEFMGKMMAL